MNSGVKGKQVKKPIENKSISILAYIFSIISFIPLLGVPFGIVAIVLGIIQKIKIPVILGIFGLSFTIIIYGSLFYAFYTNSGPYAEVKKQLAVQIITQTRGQILIYKERQGKLPQNLQDLGKPSSENFYVTTDPWMHKIEYKINKNGSFILRSDGPDGIPYTNDDIVSSD